MQDTPQIGARLAVIETRLSDILAHLVEIRAFVPARIVEQAERLSAVEKTQRSLVWGAALVGGGLLSAFLSHVFGR